MKNYHIVIIFGVLLFVSSCSNMTKGKEIAEQEITSFQAYFNNENYQRIIDSADLKLFVNTPKEEFVQILMAVHKNLVR